MVKCVFTCAFVECVRIDQSNLLLLNHLMFMIDLFDFICVYLSNPNNCPNFENEFIRIHSVYVFVLNDQIKQGNDLIETIERSLVLILNCLLFCFA